MDSKYLPTICKKFGHAPKAQPTTPFLTRTVRMAGILHRILTVGFWGWLMGRKLTVTLAIALMMFAFAPMMARADTITTPNGYPLIIPNGSQVASIFTINNPSDPGLGVTFSFSGGTGEATEFPRDGGGSVIDFTAPVTNLTFTAFLDAADSGSIEALSPTGGGFYFDCGIGMTRCPSDPFQLSVSGPVSEISIGAFQGASGIESMSFTVGVPEPSTILLLSLGLIAIPMIKHRSSWRELFRVPRSL